MRNHFYISQTTSHMIVIIVAAVSTFFVLFAVIALHDNTPACSHNNPAGQRVECYTSIQVLSGESLWEISTRYYSSEYKSLNRYMKRIMHLNHMTTEAVIAGSYLIIPYYTTPDTDMAAGKIPY